MVESSGSDEPSGRPRRIWPAGMAAMPKIKPTPSAATQGCLVANTGLSAFFGCSASWRDSSESSAARSFLFRAFMPTNDISAGVKVSAIRTANAIATAPMVPIRPKKPIPVRFSAASAMMTVRPANITALPEVPVARPMDSRSSIPVLSCLRWRLSKKRL